MRTAKTLIRLGGCPGWSESLLGAHAILLVLSWGGSFDCSGSSLLLMLPNSLFQESYIYTFFFQLNFRISRQLISMQPLARVSTSPLYHNNCLTLLKVRSTPIVITGVITSRLTIPDIATVNSSACILLSRQWITKTLTRLQGCGGWSASLLFAYDTNK